MGGVRQPFIIIFDPFLAQLRTTPHTPCDVLYFVSILIGACNHIPYVTPDLLGPFRTDRGDTLHNGLEVRADLLRSQDEGFVLSQLALVRRRSDGAMTSTSLVDHYLCS